MHEFNDELDGPAIALLELYRDAGAPSAEVEDRLLARIEAQAAIEADLEGDDHELIGAEPQPATETGVRPLTAVLIAIVAFAAGVALTVGLRSQMAQLVEDPFEPSVAPMTAEDPPAHEIAEPPAKDACGAAVLDEGEPVEEAEPVESEELDAEEEEAVDEDDEPTARSFVLPSEDDEPVDVSEGESIDEGSSAYGYGVALSPWSGAREDDNETRSSSSKRGSRSTRIGGYWGPTFGSSSSSSSTGSPASRPSTNGGARGPSAPKPSGGNGNPGGGKPGGNNGGGDRPPPPKPDPSTPPPPTSNPGNDDPPPPDDRPPEEPPPPDEPEPEPPPSDVDPCLYELEMCDTEPYDCDNDPVACEQVEFECGLLYQECAYPDQMAQCDQTFSECLLQVDTICLQGPELLDPELQELCMQLYDQCYNDYNVCLGYGDDEADPGQGVELDEYP